MHNDEDLKVQRNLTILIIWCNEFNEIFYQKAIKQIGNLKIQ